MNKETSFSTYIVDSINLWHERLGHVNFSCIKEMKELG